jgi:DNA polymerase III subunit chi
VTTIDFYTHCSDRLDVVAKLVGKAWMQHGSVRVLTGDDAMTMRLDAVLWTSPPVGFLPHCRLASPLAAETPIVVDHALVHQGPAAVLISLHSSPPPFFSRFERLAEVIGTGDEDIAAGRERWRFYTQRGYTLRSHNLAQRG